MADDSRPIHVLRDVQIVGPLILDPAYTPPWPGAGIMRVDGQPVNDAPPQAT